MNLFAIPSIVCRCGRVFFDGQDVWSHVREEHRHEQEAEELSREMQKRIREVERRDEI